MVRDSQGVWNGELMEFTACGKRLAMRAYSNHFNILHLRERTADALGSDGAETRPTAS